MSRTPGFIIPSSYSSQEELEEDLRRRSGEAGFTQFNFSDFAGPEVKHYGIKGMRWGIRRADPSAKPPASDDYQTAKAAKAKVKAGGVKSLSNDELKTYLERMDLEKRYHKGNPTAKKEATDFVKDTLVAIGKEESKKYAVKQVAKALAGRG